MIVPDNQLADARSGTSPDPTFDPSIRGLLIAPDAEVFAARETLLHGDNPTEFEGIAFPLEVAVELAAVCNLSCVMCPVPTTSRPAQLMRPELFRRTIDQLQSEQGFVLLPQGFGESMLHARWAELLRYAVDRGVRPIVLLTNGMLLNERNVERVLDLELDALVVSIDGVTPATYAAIRVGGDLEKVEANVRRFITARAERPRPRLCLRIIRMKDTADEIEAFFARWSPLLSAGDEIRINEYNDWAGKVEDRSVDGSAATGAVPRGPCRMLWRNLSVHADGKVSACCHDSEDELIIGDLATESLQEIWRGERLRRLRRIHLEGRVAELPICHACKNWY